MALDTKDVAAMSNSTTNALEVVAGILYQLTGDEKLDEITECVGGGKGFVDEVEASFAEIAAKGFTGKIKGF
jgi:hypothetical protein